MIVYEANKICDQCGRPSRAVARLGADVTTTTVCFPCLLDAAFGLAAFRGDKLKIKHTVGCNPRARDELAGG